MAPTDFWEQFEKTVRAYLPRWRYEKDSGELEAAVLYAAAELLWDSRRRLARLGQKHEVEYLNGWPLEGQGALNACAFAALSAPRGRYVPAQSVFYLSGDGSRRWETLEDTWAGPVRLERQVFYCGRNGTLLELPPPAPQEPTRLFDFSAGEGGRQGARFLHPDAFASQNGCRVRLTLAGADPALEEFLAGEDAQWRLVREGTGDIRLPPPVREGPALCFDLPPAPDARALAVQARPGALPPRGAAGRALVSTRRLSLSPALTVTDDGVCAGEAFLPFGAVPEVWRVCCLSCPDALSLRGGQVTLSFTLSRQVREEPLPGTEPPPEYRPVMRRLPPAPPEAREAYPQTVCWEYWNGAAWFPVPEAEGLSDRFSPAGQAPARRVEARFRWPEDAAPCQVQGQTALWLRWRVREVAGGGALPRRCVAPEVASLRFSACLEDAPAAIETCGGLTGEFAPLRDGAAPLFPALGPEEDEWWLGFDRPPAGEPLRAYLSLSGQGAGGRLTAWEAAGETRRALGLEDGTDGLAHSGVVTLRDVRGQVSTRFGTEGWWLCLREESGALSRGRRFPRLEGLTWGAARVQSADGAGCDAGEPLSPLRGGSLSGVTLTPSFGGAGPEREEELLRRARDGRHHLGRAVTPLDLEQLIRGQMRDVARTRCVLKEGGVQLGVLMRDAAHHAAAFSRRRDEIRALAEEAGAFSALGLSVEVREPEFYAVNLMVWTRSDDPEGTARAARAALDRFLHPVTGHFRGEGWPMGSLPTEMETRNYLQSKLPGGAPVKLLLTVTARDGRELSGARVRDPFALPLPGAYTFRVLRGEELT